MSDTNNRGEMTDERIAIRSRRSELSDIPPPNNVARAQDNLTDAGELRRYATAPNTRTEDVQWAKDRARSYIQEARQNNQQQSNSLWERRIETGLAVRHQTKQQQSQKTKMADHRQKQKQ